MKVLTIISEFITQYIPDFNTLMLEYLVLSALIILIINLIKG